MFLSDEEYTHVIDLLDGKISKSPLLSELTEWMKCEFDAEIFDYICDYIQHGQIRLRVVVWDYPARRSFFKEGNYDLKKKRLPLNLQNLHGDTVFIPNIMMKRIYL